LHQNCAWDPVLLY